MRAVAIAFAITAGLLLEHAVLLFTHEFPWEEGEVRDLLVFGIATAGLLYGAFRCWGRDSNNL